MAKLKLPVAKRIWTTWEHLPSALVGLGALIAAVTFLVSKEDLAFTSLHKAFPTWIEYMWLIIAGVGGITAIVGVFAKHPRWEGAGLSLIGSAYIMDFIAIV